MTRPQQIKREKVFGNFRVRAAKKPHKNAQTYKDRPGMSEAHLALVRKLPCVMTGQVPGGEAHHVKTGTGERGMGLRSTDKWAVPLSHDAHMELERAGSRNELAWFAMIGIDPVVLAQDLWAATGDLPKMTRIVIAHMRDGKR